MFLSLPRYLESRKRLTNMCYLCMLSIKMTSILMKCPSCGGINIIRKGKTSSKVLPKQVFLCKECGKRFSSNQLANRTYSPKVIAAAISAYNLGNTFEASAKSANSRYKVKISKSTVHQWTKEFGDICTYHKLRAEAIGKYGKDILTRKTFEHNGLSYNFAYHKAKLEKLSRFNRFLALAEYVKSLENGCPDYFGEDTRCSELRFDIECERSRKHNHACRLAELVLPSARTKRDRHQVIEDFMLINDSTTIACEVPVWFWDKTLNSSISGHIDILQIRANKIFILDYKPNAVKEKKAPSQLYHYALGLSFRTKIPLSEFRCAWFDEYDYYEFEPSKAKVKTR